MICSGMELTKTKGTAAEVSGMQDESSIFWFFGLKIANPQKQVLFCQASRNWISSRHELNGHHHHERKDASYPDKKGPWFRKARKRAKLRTAWAISRVFSEDRRWKGPQWMCSFQMGTRL
ncbi:hypothetical cytosolic protein [Syntrophus aciditrophicus SB]|uniref:Hypothetical cytosolic protein n=2 Tax=Syntrophus TaxID=43773 RepID=Q2LYH5_SYNAS|nr:hypothetical cytosolic protein [Syntrophus aciditrophicus SB]